MLTQDEFREVMGLFASGVTVITTTSDGERFGTTASAVSSLSLEPPMLLVCLNATSATGRAIASSKHFAVNILGEDHSDVAIRFATRNIDKFRGIEVLRGDGDLPLLADAIATLECAVSQTAIGGTHYVFLAEVGRADGHLGAPLAYFRGQFGRLELAEDEAAARAIRERVLHRRIPIGEPLDLSALAEDVQAPRGSVYHALARLAAEGWVDHDADGAFSVPPVTRESLVESARARIAIFAGAAVTALPIASDAAVEELERLVAALAPGAGDVGEVDSWFARRTAMVTHLMAMTDMGSVLLDAFHRADVPAEIHSFLFRDGAPDHDALSQIHAGYASIVDACIRGNHADLPRTVRELVDHYDSLYGRVDQNDRQGSHG